MAVIAAKPSCLRNRISLKKSVRAALSPPSIFSRPPSLKNIFIRAVNFVDTIRVRAKHLRVILMSLYRQANLPIHRREFPRPLLPT